MEKCYKARILIVDDDTDMLESLSRMIIQDDYQILCNTNVVIDKLEKYDPDVLILDLKLIPINGIEVGLSLISNLISKFPWLRIIVLTGERDVKYGIQALYRGAAHFLNKPADPNHLKALIRDSANQSFLRRQYKLFNDHRNIDLATVLIGKSSKLEKVKENILLAGLNSLPVLIIGETGTGKGICAKAIHQFGKRKNEKFIVYQPFFSSPDLFNSELFGHAKGAFTGAVNEKKGLLEIATNGTFFLDEVAELPTQSQIALLGVLQEKVIRPLGSSKNIQINFRLVSATNKDLKESLEKGSLRNDFFHRINQHLIHIPPLRERLEDIPLIALSVINSLYEKKEIKFNTIEDNALNCMYDYNWPGNIRELISTIEKVAFKVDFLGKNIIKAEDLIHYFNSDVSYKNTSLQDVESLQSQVDEFKYLKVKEVLQKCSGNQSEAAQLLKVDRTTLRRILNKK
jgi:DNA-binding NtrC family response regulator